MTSPGSVTEAEAIRLARSILGGQVISSRPNPDYVGNARQAPATPSSPAEHDHIPVADRQPGRVPEWAWSIYERER